MAKVEMPLQRLNDALEGGIEDGSNVLILADLAVDKSKFASAIANYRMEQGDNLIYHINNKMPRYIKEKLDSEDEEKVSFVDGFSSTLGKETEEKYKIETNLKDDRAEYIQESKELAKQAITENEGFGSTFILDSLDAFTGKWDELEEFVNDLKPVAEETNTVNYYLLPNLGFEEDGEDYEKFKDIFDYVLHLKGLERSGIILKYIDVIEPDTKTKVPFDVNPRGLVMYVPKILVTGPYDAGKSTTVQGMSDESVSVDRLGTTVALDHGKVDREGLKAELFGTPGQKRFDWALNFLGQSMFGCFIVADSRDPQYERINQLKKDLEAEDLPFIVLANFQNKEGAKSPEEIEEELGIETIGIDAKNGDNLDQSLERLINKILDQHSWYYS